MSLFSLVTSHLEIWLKLKRPKCLFMISRFTDKALKGWYKLSRRRARQCSGMIGGMVSSMRWWPTESLSHLWKPKRNFNLCYYDMYVFLQVFCMFSFFFSHYGNTGLIKWFYNKFECHSMFYWIFFFDVKMTLQSLKVYFWPCNWPWFADFIHCMLIFSHSIVTPE